MLQINIKICCALVLVTQAKYAYRGAYLCIAIIIFPCLEHAAKAHILF